jgi:hypothetical protein
MDEKYKLVRWDEIRDNRGEVFDHAFTVICESKTLKGAVAYARMKKLDKNYHFIEKEIKEQFGFGYRWVTTDDSVIYL